MNTVFAVSGNKLSSLFLDENSLQFSSTTYNTVDAFKAAFAKKISLSSKLEIKYSAIRSIKKEEGEKNILIKYNSFLGLPGDCEFSFNNLADYDTFFSYLEKQHYFTKTAEQLTPFRAILNYLFGLAFTLAITSYCYYQAVEIANGTAEEPSTAKARAFNYAIGLLGGNAVVAIGAAIAAYLLYKIWKRFTNPPNQIKLLPQNA